MNDAQEIVIEVCENCKIHDWNNRLDETKYQSYFNKVAAAIIERIPNAKVSKNKIPKSYINFEIYFTKLAFKKY